MFSHFSRWMNLSRDMAALTVESQTVIALRMAKLAVGGKGATAESHRMVSEKIAALTEAQVALGMDMALGRGLKAPERAIALYRNKVKANIRRLT